MHPALNGGLFFFKEHVGAFDVANNYDIFDPASGQKVLECREPNLGLLTELFRFIDLKLWAPFEVVVTTPEGQVVLTARKGISIFWSCVEVCDEAGSLVGYFKEKSRSIGGKFDVLDVHGTVVGTLRGKWTGWDFRFVQGDVELARVSKKWAGLGKELFTSADNYMLTINSAVPASSPVRVLILAAVLCIDMVLNE